MKVISYFAVVASLALGLSAHAQEPSGLYKQALTNIQNLHEQYPGFTHIFSIGQNDDGTELYAIRISTTPEVSDPKKVGHLIVGTHHGNEQKCPALVTNFANELLKKYSGRELFQSNLADTEWVIIPVLNVTGYNGNNRYEHSVDPNRDYPGICSSQKGGKLKSIRTLMTYLQSRIWTGTITVHGYIGTMTYPWGVDLVDPKSLDNNTYEKITAKAAALNGYRYGTHTDIVYPAEGTYEDYTYIKHGIWTLLIEMRNGSQKDIVDTTAAMETWFDQLDSSPSTHNQLTSACHRSGKLDLHNE